MSHIECSADLDTSSHIGSKSILSMKKVSFLVDFPSIDETSNLGEYFINKHNTYYKELNFNFPENQKSLKSIKISLRKLKKSDFFLKNLDFSKKSKISRFSKSHFL